MCDETLILPYHLKVVEYIYIKEHTVNLLESEKKSVYNASTFHVYYSLCIYMNMQRVDRLSKMWDKPFYNAYQTRKQ